MAAPTSRRGIGRDLALGLAVVIGLFALSELVLWALGIGGAAGTHLSRGFDATAAYLVPDPQRPGGWRTQVRDQGGAGERRIPPRGDATRILLFGGSNTDGFPEQVLRNRLADETGLPREALEVVNLGRSGYGSARVSILFEQALAALDPDVVVIYSGHNEFVEASFRRDLDTRFRSGWGVKLAELARHSRTVNALADRFARQRVSLQKKPEAWKGEFEKFAAYTWPQTLEVMDRYEQNLEHMIELAERSGVRVVLCTVIWNRFSSPFATSLGPGLDEAARAEFNGLWAEALGLLPPDVRALVPPPAARVQSADWGALPIRAWAKRDQLPALRPSTGILAKIDPRLPAPELWSPKVRPFLDHLERFLRRELDEGDREALEQARELLHRALAIAPDHPRALFELALVEYALAGDEAEIVRLFTDAARYDRAPRKGSELSNGIVRELAARHPGVRLVDADAIFCERVPMGLVGWEWMIDHCHLCFGARPVVMADLAREMASMEVFAER